MSQLNEISVKINEPHNGKPITAIEVSPKVTYLVTYSSEDKSIIGWYVEDTDEGHLKQDDYRHAIVHDLEKYNICNICVSDDKKLAYIYGVDSDNCRLVIIDMNNNGKEIELNLDIFESITNYYCTFNLKGDFILYNKVDNIYNKFDTRNDIIRIYNTQTKNNKWTCKSIYKIPEGFEFISISKYNKLYLLSSNDHCIYECNLRTEECLKIFIKGGQSFQQ
ncbi:hypothetical protein C1645_834068 [Glomus cerebriforme]|uniref:WD40-repeat-containing domain protein n=1 Tax=Glomus cerebriforme TaxID=658196 RepID=A0A397SGC9_9GLOM|nr:hypothetical protein C1645_834068 [Glomus cerebriforme]